MQKNRITNKITPCCGLPFSVVYWWVSNLTLNSEADRQYLLTQISQSGVLSIDGWKVLINSGTLEADASLTKAEFLAWFDCGIQPSCEQFKILIESYKLGNYNPLDEYGVGWTEVFSLEEYNTKIIKKINGYVGGVGSIPTELQDNTGKYYASGGGFTSDKNLATNFGNNGGYKGEAIVSTKPTIWNFGDLDYSEIYSVNTSGTFIYFKDSDNNSINVTEQDLKENFVELLVKNGVSKKKLSVKPTGADLATTFDKDNDTDAQSAKSIYAYMINELWFSEDSMVVWQNDKLTFKNFINNNGESINLGQSWDFSTDYIDVDEGDLINYKAMVYADGNIVSFYDADGTYLSGVSGVGVYPNGTILQGLIFVPPTAKKVKFYTTNFLNVLDGGQNFSIKRKESEKTIPNKVNGILSPLYNIDVEYTISEFIPNEIGYYDGARVFHAESGYLKAFNIDLNGDVKKIDLYGYGFWSGGEATLYGVKIDNSIDVLQPRSTGNEFINKSFDMSNYKAIFGTLMAINGVIPTIKIYSNGNSEIPIDDDKKLETFIKRIAGENKDVFEVGAKLEVAKPNNAIKVNFVTSEALPADKGPKISGKFIIEIDNLLFEKYGTITMQGTSTAIYPKKNWTFAFFNEEAKTSAFKMSINHLPYHDEFVFKSDWVDSTHMRNIISVRLWEKMVQSRKGFPKREFNEFVYNPTDSTFENRFPTKAIGHVDGFPCVMSVNGAFYGIGMFNIGKKRDNYNLIKSNKNHIQLEDGSDGQRNLITWKATDWNVRNPAMSNYIEEGEILDVDVKAKIDRLFAYHGSGKANMIANFTQYYNKKNIFDKLILSQSIYDLDGIAKNYMLTTWDGNIWTHLPYDLDSTFGLNFDGKSYYPADKDVFTHYATIGGEEQIAFLSGANFYKAILEGYSTEINARYKQLRDENILTIDSIYEIAMELNLKFGDDNYKKEFETWANQPSNNIVYTSISQILKYMEDRFIWLDTYFNYTP